MSDLNSLHWQELKKRVIAAGGEYTGKDEAIAFLLSSVVITEEQPDSAAQVLANRIWEGQSVDLPRNVRIARINAGVEAQGMSFDGVVLPDA